MNCIQRMADRPPFAWLGGQDALQLLMLGCEGAGKTTLLYRLKIDGWKKPDITRDMELLRRGVDSVDANVRDPSYHYEEFTSMHSGKYGIWDVPGSEPLVRMWPMFYRYLRIDALIYVVDCFSSERERFDRIAKARRQLWHLLNEDELRCAAVVLVLNTKGLDAPGGGGARPSFAGDGAGRRGSLDGRAAPAGDAGREEDPAAEEETAEERLTHEREEEFQLQLCFYEMLGVPEIEASAPHRKRFFKYAFSCADVAQGDEDWTRVLKDVYKAYNQVGEASMPIGV